LTAVRVDKSSLLNIRQELKPFIIHYQLFTIKREDALFNSEQLTVNNEQFHPLSVTLTRTDAKPSRYRKRPPPMPTPETSIPNFLKIFYRRPPIFQSF